MLKRVFGIVGIVAVVAVAIMVYGRMQASKMTDDVRTARLEEAEKAKELCDLATRSLLEAYLEPLLGSVDVSDIETILRTGVVDSLANIQFVNNQPDFGELGVRMLELVTVSYDYSAEETVISGWTVGEIKLDTRLATLPITRPQLVANRLMTECLIASLGAAGK